jgi:hypothetical protein
MGQGDGGRLLNCAEVQFLIERSCRKVFRGLSYEPFAIWVYWPPSD